MAETEDLKSFQYRFESDRGHVTQASNLRSSQARAPSVSAIGLWGPEGARPKRESCTTLPQVNQQPKEKE